MKLFPLNFLMFFKEGKNQFSYKMHQPGVQTEPKNPSDLHPLKI